MWQTHFLKRNLLICTREKKAQISTALFFLFQTHSDLYLWWREIFLHHQICGAASSAVFFWERKKKIFHSDKIKSRETLHQKGNEEIFFIHFRCCSWQLSEGALLHCIIRSAIYQLMSFSFSHCWLGFAKSSIRVRVTTIEITSQYTAPVCGIVEKCIFYFQDTHILCVKSHEAWDATKDNMQHIHRNFPITVLFCFYTFIVSCEKNLCIVRKNVAVCQVVTWGETIELSSPMQSYSVNL